MPITNSREGKTNFILIDDIAGGGGNSEIFTEFNNLALPITLTVLPAGGTVRAEYTTTQPSIVNDNPDNGLWFPWSEGDVSVATTGVIDFKISGLRLASSAGGVLQILF